MKTLKQQLREAFSANLYNYDTAWRNSLMILILQTTQNWLKQKRQEVLHDVVHHGINAEVYAKVLTELLGELEQK
jgi:hypothetical protein